jgi:DNA/RNA endonuclease G (NUC1)
MKKAIALLSGIILMLIFTSGSSEKELRERVRWHSTYMTGVYSEKLEQPIRVAYIVPCNEGGASREGLEFRTHPTVHTSDDADYVSNVWDKGHMAPAGAYKCDQQAMKETFSYLNCALQHENLNRGVWKSLEEHERDLAEKKQVNVLVVVDFAAMPIRVPAGAAIPIGFYKEINQDTIRECYWFPNKMPEYRSYKNYKCKCR